MSIYQARLKRPISGDDASVSLTASAKPAPARRTQAVQADEDWAQIWSHRRKATPARNLLPVSVKWLLNLPNDVRPLALVSKYPRVANVLALQWSQPTSCRAHFNDLLADRRGNRKGFPAEVQRELRALRDYYYDLHAPVLQLALVE